MGDSYTGSDDPERCDRKRRGSVSVTPVCAGVSGVDGESSKEEVMFRLRPGRRVGDGQKGQRERLGQWELRVIAHPLAHPESA